jgi:ABC-type antimicrobial peptide transport system permease subunit
LGYSDNSLFLAPFHPAILVVGKEKPMSQSSQPVQPENRLPFASIVTLAYLRLRQTWFLLFITALGVIAAVVIACAVPLFSTIMTTAALRNTLNATPTSSEIQINASPTGFSSAVSNSLDQQMTQLLQQNLGSLVQPEQSMIATEGFSFATPPPVKPANSQSSIEIFATNMTQAAPHIALAQGRLPQLTARPASELEALLTTGAAKQLHAQIGSTFQLQLSYYKYMPNFSGFNNNNQAPPLTQNVTLRVVGIFNSDGADPYWHGQNFNTQVFQGQHPFYFFSALVSDKALLALFDQLSSANHTLALYTPSIGGYNVNLYYRLDTPHIVISNLNMLINGLANIQENVGLTYGGNDGSLYVQSQQILVSHLDISGDVFDTPNSPSNLELLQSRVNVAQIPITVLTIQIVALILFFVSLMMNLLVDRQTDAIALLRSRGASSWQIFGALFTQSLLLALLALIVGIPLAIFIVLQAAQHILPAAERNAVNAVTAHLQPSLESVLWYALIVVAVILLTMSFSIFVTARSDVLTLRRDVARSKQRPFWERLNLDVIAGVIALVGYIISLYVTNIGNVLEPDARALIAVPLSMIAPFFLIIGCMLLFLRLFPQLLRLGAWLASRGRSAVSLLALAQLARSPRLSLRMTMLLALSIAFALFTLIYTSSQTYHIQEINTYLAGADFIGTIPSTVTADNTVHIDPRQWTQNYDAIPGVLDASVGYSNDGYAGNISMPIELRAVDPTTFANTVIWPTPKEKQTAKVLLARLQASSQQAVTSGVLPLVVDQQVLTTLRLHVGSPLVVKEGALASVGWHGVIIGVLPHIPTVDDRFPTGSNNIITGGVLVNYASYIAVFTKEASQLKSTLGPVATPQVNTVWLHTKSDAKSLARVRVILSSSPQLYLANIVDRYALVSALDNDPFYVVVGGILAIGTITSLLLVLVGDLLASWLSARTRVTNFAVLRALGTSPQQVSGVLMWEQAIIYLAGLLLGVIFGLLLATTVIPSLTFTDLTNNASSNIYALQSALPTSVVIPSTLPLALIVLAIIYIVALLFMVRTVMRTSLSQSLRLNED